MAALPVLYDVRPVVCVASLLEVFGVRELRAMIPTTTAADLLAAGVRTRKLLLEGVRGRQSQP